MARCCPECSLRLEQRLHHRVEIDICFRCKGAWFDTPELSQTLSGPGGRPTAFTAFFNEQSLRPVASTALRCPVCVENALIRVAWGETSAAKCALCSGIWISAEGLRRLRAQLYRASEVSSEKESQAGTNPWEVVGDILLFVLATLG